MGISQLLVALVAVVLGSQAVAGFMVSPPAAVAARSMNQRRSTHLNGECKVEFTISKKTVPATVGEPLGAFLAKHKIKVPYNCKQGDCATCVVDIDGRKVKACVGKVPLGRRVLKIKK